ncbi:MAG: hypothetical protein NW220_20600 [Leptolyngbyaceae cyanobacterium bins.349]|nr:hypothetical protein [Leptolyngbyaceae cyanobacterium bins.349]
MAKVSAHMAKDVFHWRLLVSALQELPLKQMVRQVKREVMRQRRSGRATWFMVGVGAIAMLCWDGRLFLATGTGIGVMGLVYLMHDWQPTLNLSALQKGLDGWNQPFLVAAGAGAIATFLTYLAASVWVDAPTRWIASGAILQSMATLVVLLLLITQMLNQQDRRDLIPYNKFVSDLVNDDPLKRLIAVRQLTEAVSVLQDAPRDRRLGAAKQPSRQEIADYFRLMLQREEEAIVRDAIYNGLQTLDIVYQLKQATEPLLQIAPRPIHRSNHQRVASSKLLHPIDR